MWLACVASSLPLACTLRMDPRADQAVRCTAAALFALPLSFSSHRLHMWHKVSSLSQFAECITTRQHPQLGLPKDLLHHHHRFSAFLAHAPPLPALGAAEVWSDLASTPAQLQPGCVACFTWSRSHPEHRLCCSIELNMSYAYQQVSSFFNRDVSPSVLGGLLCDSLHAHFLCSQPNCHRCCPLLALTGQEPSLVHVSCTMPAQVVVRP